MKDLTLLSFDNINKKSIWLTGVVITVLATATVWAGAMVWAMVTVWAVVMAEDTGGKFLTTNQLFSIINLEYPQLVVSS